MKYLYIILLFFLPVSLFSYEFDVTMNLKKMSPSYFTFSVNSKDDFFQIQEPIRVWYTVLGKYVYVHTQVDMLDDYVFFSFWLSDSGTKVLKTNRGDFYGDSDFTYPVYENFIKLGVWGNSATFNFMLLGIDNSLPPLDFQSAEIQSDYKIYENLNKYVQGGVKPYFFSTSSILPSNFNLNSNGMLTGYLLADTGSFSIDVVVTDNMLATAQAKINIKKIITKGPLDSDGDGYSDSQEILMGTDPFTANEHFKGDSDHDGVTDGEELNQKTDPYDVNDFRDSDSDGVPDNVEILEGTNHLSKLSFYDSDGDGVPDNVELRNSTNPKSQVSKVDTDGDGVPDYYEFVTETDQNNKNDFKDSDGDGISDYEEFVNNSDMNDINSIPDKGLDFDGDGIPDYLEKKYGTDKNSKDSILDKNKDLDGDGISDIDEINEKTDPYNSNSNRKNKDTDSDGVSDDQEKIDGTSLTDSTIYNFNSKKTIISNSINNNSDNNLEDDEFTIPEKEEILLPSRFGVFSVLTSKLTPHLPDVSRQKIDMEIDFGNVINGVPMKFSVNPNSNSHVSQVLEKLKDFLRLITKILFSFTFIRAVLKIFIS